MEWIKGERYDYPEGYERYFQCLFDDLNCYKTLGEWEEVKQKIPKELHRRRWMVGVATFTGEKGSIAIRFTDGEYIPMRTINWILKNDKILPRIKRQYAGN